MPCTKSSGLTAKDEDDVIDVNRQWANPCLEHTAGNRSSTGVQCPCSR